MRISPNVYRIAADLYERVLGDLPVDEVGEDEVYRLYGSMDGMAEATKRLYLGELGRAIGYVTGRDPVAETGIRWRREDQRRVFIEIEQWWDLLDAASLPQVRLVLMLGAYLGMRRGEMASLTLADVDGDVVLIKGKGGKDERRTMPPALADEMTSYLGWRSARIAELGDMSGGRVLLRTKDTGPATPSIIGMWARDLRDRTGIEFTTHSLRRLYATVLYDGGADIETIRRMMRHSSPTVTVNCYIAARPDRYEKAEDALSHALKRV